MTKKGLIVTLLTVTFAFLRVSAHATAPVITDPGDVVIGDLEQQANNNVFVYPDAINLSAIVSDDTTPAASIKWTYSSTRYRINGVAPVVIGVDDPNNPGAKNINGNDSDILAATNDGNSLTATFRDEVASPQAGGPAYGDPATSPGVFASEVITLYASDCSTYTAQQIIVYSSEDTSDSISKAGLTFVLDDDFDNDPSLIGNWLGGVTPGTGTTGTATGLCMWVPLVNTSTSAQVGWISPPNINASPGTGYVDLVDKAVYRFRLDMYTDQTGNDAIPFWDFGYNNFYIYNNAGNNYGGALWVLDVAGGANGIGRAQGRTQYDFWATPIAALTDQWRGQLVGAAAANNANAMINNTANDNFNDMTLILRVLDGSPAIATNNDTGVVCCKRIRVDRANIDSLASRTTHAFGGALTTSAYAINPDSYGQSGNGTAQINSGVATFAMGGPYAGVSTTQAGLGGRKALIFDSQTPAGNFNVRWFPVIWADDELLQLSFKMRSNVGGGAGTTEGTDPVDVAFINFDVSATSEIGGFQFVQKSVPGNGYKAGSPYLPANTASGTAQTYTGFFYTQNTTVVDPLVLPDSNRVRGYADFINNAALGTGTDGKDQFAIESMDMYKIDTTGF